MHYSKAEFRDKTVRHATLVGLVINLALSAIKIITGIFGRSSALVADGIHSISDCTSDAAILIGSRYWSLPPDKGHPYGHQRIETLVTAGIGFAVGGAGVIMLYDGIYNLKEGNHQTPSVIAAVAALVSVIAKEVLYRWTLKKAESADSSALRANAWHHRTDAFSSLPVVGAVLASQIFPEWNFLDSVGEVVVASFVLHAAAGIIRPTLHEILDSNVPKDLYYSILEISESTEGVESVHDLRTRYMGPGVHVDLHAVVDSQLTVYTSHKIAQEIEWALRTKHREIVDVLIHIDPYDDREEHGAKLKELP
jgi:cation diffusion facilitator family transporter